MPSYGKERHGDTAPASGISCHSNALTAALGLSTEETLQLDEILVPPIQREKGEILFRQDAPFSSLFVVRSGSLKQETAIDKDEYLLTVLWLPGDIIGCDAIGAGHYPATVAALETTTLYEFPFSRLEALGSRLPRLRRLLQGNISRAIHEERLRLHQLLSRTAEARLAYFLLAISDRFRRRGYSPSHFRLALSRNDMGSYLGLTQETVGRTLAAYQAQQLLDVRGREYHLLDFVQLERLASSTGRRQKRA